VTNPSFWESLQFVESVCTVWFYLLAWVILYRWNRRRKLAAMRTTRADIADALSSYLCGNPETDRLRKLAEAHPDYMRETILHYQSIVLGRGEELCDLTVQLGCAQRG
jgi:hypothetical protein